MKHNPLLIPDLFDERVYYEIEPEFWDLPISSSARGLYLVLTALGRSREIKFNTLLSLGCGSEAEINRSLAELDRVGFDTSNLVRA